MAFPWDVTEQHFKKYHKIDSDFVSMLQELGLKRNLVDDWDEGIVNEFLLNIIAEQESKKVIFEQRQSLLQQVNHLLEYT